MNAEERDLILSLFDRIDAATTRDNDPEAERLIRDAVSRNPNAPYVLVQSVLVQEEALKRADERIRQLESSRAAAEPSPSRSFLGGGRAMPSSGSVPNIGGRPGATDQTRQPGQPDQAGQRDKAAAQRNRGGGFLSNALSTAGGVAGGMLLAESIRGLFSGGASGSSIFGGPAEAKTPAEDKASANQTNEDQAAEDAAQDEAQDAEFEDDGYDYWGGDDDFEI